MTTDKVNQGEDKRSSNEQHLEIKCLLNTLGLTT